MVAPAFLCADTRRAVTLRFGDGVVFSAPPPHRVAMGVMRLRTVLLVGVPNCGKSALFCRLTGGHARVGNFAGVTVERREGLLPGSDIRITDTPGICSLTPTRAEEAVTCDAVSGHPALIVQVVDGAAPLRSFRLARELASTGLPLLFAVSRADVYHAQGREPDTAAVSAALGAPVIAVSSHSGEGIEPLREAIRRAVSERDGADNADEDRTDTEKGKAEKTGGNNEQGDGATPEKPGTTVMREREDAAFQNDGKRMPPVCSVGKCGRCGKCHARGAADAVRVTDSVGGEKTGSGDRGRMTGGGGRHGATGRGKGLPSAGHLTCLLLAGAAFTAGHRYDRLLAGRRWGYLFAGAVVTLLLVLTCLAFSLTGTLFDAVGGWATARAAGWLTRAGAPALLVGFLAEGCLGSLLSALSFSPPLFLYYAATAALDDCGYLSRMTFLFDRACARVGLGGGVVMPCLLSLGCGVTGVGACRTLSGRERRGCAGFCTYFPCHAKIPLICAVVREAGLGVGGYIVLFLFPCLVGAIAVAIAGRSHSVYIEELPPLTAPAPGVVWRAALWRGAAFLRRAGGIIALSGALFWLLAHIGADFRPSGVEESLLAGLGRALLPVFAPLGISSFGAVAATLAGFIAKENSAVVLDILGGASLLGSPTGAVSFCLFGLLSPPCVAAAAEMRRVIGRRAYLYLAAELAVAFGVCAAWHLLAGLFARL